MAQAHTSSNPSTRRSLRLIKAERKSASAVTPESNIDDDEDSQPTARQAKYKAIEAISIGNSKRRSEPDIDSNEDQQTKNIEEPSEEQPSNSNFRKRTHSKQISSSSSPQHSIRHVANTVSYRKRNKTSNSRLNTSSTKTLKRQRQSSSEDEGERDDRRLSTHSKPKRNSAPIISNRTRSRSNQRKRTESASDLDQTAVSAETGNLCVRRGQGGRDLTTVASDPSNSQNRRSRNSNHHHRQSSHKRPIDYLTTGQSTSSRSSVPSTNISGTDGRSCNSNTGLGSSTSASAVAHPLQFFNSPAYYQQRGSTPPNSSAQSYSGIVPPGSSYSSGLVASAASASTHRHSKVSIPMSTESDTDPENNLGHMSPTTPRDVLADPTFARAAAAAAAAAAGSPTGAALFHTLSGRVQHLMSRVSGSSMHSMNGRLQQYMQGIQSPDPDVRLSTLNELCSLLVMSNEETLPGFQFRALYPSLRDCLADTHEAHTEIALTACRALTYLMEALPRSAGQVVEATPIFLSKLRSITSIDIAEQALTALEMISKRHGKQILIADGISACLEFIDFFSITSQNKSLAIVSNCCLYIVTRQDFHYIRPHLENLSNRLRSDEKKTVEHVCHIFSRLVENFHRDASILREIASESLLKTMQTMLIVQPSLLNSLTFVSIIHMLYRFSAYCPILAVTLLKMNIADTMITLLVGSNDSKNTLRTIPITYKSATLGNTTVTTTSNSSPIQSMASISNIELIPRTPQELFEIVSLIGEMMPRLPSDDPLFQVDQLYRRSAYHNRSYDAHGGHGQVFWHWQDDQGQLRPYSHQDSRAIEHAWQQHEEEVQLMIGGRSYLIDLQQLQQINEETNHVRFIKRLISPEISSNEFSDDSLFSSRTTTAATSNNAYDPRSEMMKEHADLYNNFIQSLFTILYEVYNSSAGPAVKHRCLQALLRMIYYSSSDLLEQILKQQSISSHIASMLASSDYKIIISALQMAEILMKKLPNIFSVYFYREGVVHQIEILIGFGVSSSSSLSMARTSNSRSQLDLTHVHEDPSTTPEEQPVSRAVSRRHQTTAEFQTATARIETRSQRARLPHSSRLKASTRSILDEMSSKSATTLDVNIHRTRSTRESLLFRPNSSIDPNNYYSRPPVYVPSPFAYASNVPAAATFLIPTPASPMILSSQEKTNLREWIKNQAERFRQTYFSKTSSTSNIALQIIHRLASAVDLLHVAKSHEENAQALREMASIIGKGDISPFEMVHSGLITKLFQYLTDDLSTSHSRVDRLKQFLEIFLSIPTVSSSNQDLHKEEQEEQALKQYIIDLHHSKSVSVRLPTQLFSHLIQKLHGCINHLEQFPIRVNDIAGRPAQSSALRLITTHQLKCNLVRHPQCKTLKQWTSGPVKIDPLALVSAIEKYLLLRGIGISNPEDPTSPTEDDDDDDDEDGDDDNESEVTNESDNEDVINVLTRASALRLEFTINDHVIPHHMTIYQAVRLYSNPSHPRMPDAESETDTDDSILGSSMLWSRIHTIHYRPATIQPPSSTAVATTMNTAIGGACTTTTTSNRLRRSLPSSTTTSNSKRSSKSSKHQSLTAQIDDLWNHGQVPTRKSLLNCSLNEPISSMLTINDLSLNAIFLLRIFQGLNLYWYDLYLKTNTLFNQPNSILTLIPRQEFLSSKLTSKVNRQLQDPVVIMMGQIPPWITELARSCLFLFPFETRQMLFYPCAFDRERAMQRLLENSDVFTQQQHPNDQTDRQSIVPRIERKKVQLSRTNILNEMEKILDHWNSKQYLEVQYENEVGFGLGPTLEAYALLSKELQKNGLELWRTDRTFDTTVKDKDGAHHFDYVDNRHGLFPAPLPRHGKASTISKIRQKFKFIGKFMAKALMDSRLIDIPFSLIFYKWLLGQEESFTLEDLIHVDSSLYEQLKRFQNIVHRRNQVRQQSQHQSNNVQTKKRLKSKDDLSPNTNQHVDASDPLLLLDGCSIDDLSLVFVLPGYPSVELKKGGKDCLVTLENLDQYIDLIVHWTLVEGVRRQFEAVRDGFNSMFSIEHLKYFYADEIQQVFCGHGSTDLWDIKVLVESTRCDHGYNINSRPVKWLFELMSQFNLDEQRAFLQFVTGSPRLPVGGFRMLHPPLTIVRKTAESNNDNINPDAFLPSVMTCVNYLKLPEYSSKDILKSKLFTAIRDGQYAFLLS